VPNEQQMAAVTPTQLPMNYATGKPGTVQDVFSDGLAGYEHAFGKTYTYGRDVDLQFVTSTGDDEAAQRADAITVKEMKPFTVLDAATTDLAIFDTEMVRAKIPVFSLYVGVAATLEQAPYRWGQQDPVAGSMNAAEFIGKQLVGKKAQYAGDAAMHDKTRVFGLVRSEVIDTDFFNQAAKKYGVKIIEPILDAMGIEHHLIERDADAQGIAPVIEKAFANSTPTAILIGREPR